MAICNGRVKFELKDLDLVSGWVLNFQILITYLDLVVNPKTLNICMIFKKSEFLNVLLKITLKPMYVGQINQ
jgi:hypothetical protein